MNENFSVKFLRLLSWVLGVKLVVQGCEAQSYPFSYTLILISFFFVSKP